MVPGHQADQVHPPSSAMARLSLVAFLALAFSGVAFATPVVSDLRARDSVPFIPCRMCGLAFGTEFVESNGIVMQRAPAL